MAKHIGIISVTYEGAALCFRSLCEQATKVMGNFEHPEISIHAYPTSAYQPAILRGDWQEVASVVLSSIEHVAKSGAEFAILPVNTIHQAFDLFASRSPIPLLHIGEVVAEEAVARNYSKLGVLGTKFLMEGPVYTDVCERKNIEVITPPVEQRERISELIYKELTNGILKDSTRDYFRQVTAKLYDQCDAIVMGCTEIPLILKQADTAAPLLDSTRLLAKAALAEALR